MGADTGRTDGGTKKKLKVEDNKNNGRIDCLYTYIMRVLVYQYKLIDYAYFMDVMQPWEINGIFDNLQFANGAEWEQTRFISYILAKANFKGIGKIKDFLPLPWENEETTQKKQLPQTITQADIKRLKELEKVWK